MKITAIYDKLLVEIIEEDEKLKSGLIIPDQAKKKPTKGVVVSAGHGFYKTNGEFQKLHVKEGDKILFNQWAANNSHIKEDGKTMIVIKEEDVLGIITD